MTELNTSYAEPNYITRLALKRAPFSKDIDPYLYFNGGQLEQRLNLLLHLARASDKVGLIIAAQGLGKSTLLAEFKKRVGDELKQCHVDFEIQQTPHQILEKCLLDLGIEQSELKTSSDIDGLFQSRLQQLNKLHLRPLLVIDNAQLMNDEALTILTKWLLWTDEEGRYLLQAIISSSNDIDLTASLSVRVQTVDIPALTAKETIHYLSERMTLAGYIGPALFSDKQLNDFYKRSKGNPKVLNQVVHQHLLGFTSSPFIRFNLPSFKMNRRWFGVMILMALFSLLLINQDRLNALFEQNNLDTDGEVEIISAPETLTTINVEPDQVRSNEDAVRQELSDLINDIPDGVRSSKNIKGYQISPENSHSILNHEEWINKQQGNNYTFQLMGSWDKQEALDFIDQYALKGQVAMFESTRNERVWYAIVYGVYSTKKEALDASNNWPAPLNTLPSWLRRFDSIQKQIKSKP
jgi:DamX protein